MGLQHRHGVVADVTGGKTARRRKPLHEMRDERGDIVAPFGQRGNTHRHDIEAVIQIFAEPPGFGFDSQVAGGGAEYARIHLHPVGAADAGEGLVNQHAQNLALGFQRHVGNFIQIERAVMRQFEQAGLARALGIFHAEQFHLDALRRHGGAVDGDKGVARAAGARMDQSRRHFFSRARGAGNQHAAVGRGDFVNQGAQLRDAGGLAHQFAVIAGLQFQFLHFALEAGGFQRPFHHMQQPIGLEGFFDKIIGALLDRGDCRFDGAMARNHHHRQIGLFALEHVKHLDAVQLGALQPDIQNDQLRTAGTHRGERGFAIARAAGFIPFIRQDARDQIPDIPFVVHHQDFRRDQRSVLAHLRFLFAVGLFARRGM